MAIEHSASLILFAVRDMVPKFVAHETIEQPAGILRRFARGSHRGGSKAQAVAVAILDESMLARLSEENQQPAGIAEVFGLDVSQPWRILSLFGNTSRPVAGFLVFRSSQEFSVLSWRWQIEVGIPQARWQFANARPVTRTSPGEVYHHPLPIPLAAPEVRLLYRQPV
jgi:hypothetical protein